MVNDKGTKKAKIAMIGRTEKIEMKKGGKKTEDEKMKEDGKKTEDEKMIEDGKKTEDEKMIEDGKKTEDANKKELSITIPTEGELKVTLLMRVKIKT